MTNSCDTVNTYEVLEHVMGITGLHPHRLDTIRNMREKLVKHVSDVAVLSEGVILDIGCGSGAGTAELAKMFSAGQRVIGIDINARAIESAKKQYSSQANLSFYHGDLKGLLERHPDFKMSAAICISVSMFINDVYEFYRHVYHSLAEGGLFIDAPFLFREMKNSTSEKFQRNTYAVCGCNMTMQQMHQLRSTFMNAGFSNIDCWEHDFDLMKLSVLFSDYSALYLLRNFVKNVISPPAHFGTVSSRYLLHRTLKIFIFFLRNRNKYAAGEFLAVKSSMQSKQKNALH